MVLFLGSVRPLVFLFLTKAVKQWKRFSYAAIFVGQNFQAARVSTHYEVTLTKTLYPLKKKLEAVFSKVFNNPQLFGGASFHVSSRFCAEDSSCCSSARLYQDITPVPELFHRLYVLTSYHLSKFLWINASQNTFRLFNSLVMLEPVLAERDGEYSNSTICDRLPLSVGRRKRFNIYGFTSEPEFKSRNSTKALLIWHWFLKSGFTIWKM